MKLSTTHKRMLVVFVFIGLLFLSLIVTLSVFELHGKASIINNSYNRRLFAYEQTITRGSIYDRSGVLLASTPSVEASSGNPQRIRQYPFKGLYAHVIGYNSKLYGKTMIEGRFNDALLGRDSFGALKQFVSLMTQQELVGNDLHLTIDHPLQAKARELLGRQHGAVVALNPQTGEILAMVSTPDFDPNEAALGASWAALLENESSPLLPRATMGLYPPGSTYKVITALAALEQDLGEFRFSDQGTTTIDGKVFNNSRNRRFGEIGLKEGVTHSSNVYFAELSQLLDVRKFVRLSEAFGINGSVEFSLPLSRSRMSTESMGATELAATALGQGKLLVTPMQMALVAAWIGNDGVMMRPYLVSEYEREKKIGQLSNSETIGLLKDMMVSVVAEGTGVNAAVRGFSVAGKTGTAQNERSGGGESHDHAWFIGFAPADKPTIALAVVLEYQGQGGGQAAAPIAQKLFSMWLNK